MAFHDRLGDTYRAKGHNISTAEVEQAMGTHPNIESANVYAIDMKQFGYEGQLGCAALTLRNEAEELDTMRTLEEHLVKVGLANYAVPRFVRVIVDIGEDVGIASQESVGSEHVSLMLKKLKTGLRKEGFAPIGNDRIYWVEREGAGFQPLSLEQKDALRTGKARL